MSSENATYGKCVCGGISVMFRPRTRGSSCIARSQLSPRCSPCCSNWASVVTWLYALIVLSHLIIVESVMLFIQTKSNNTWKNKTCICLVTVASDIQYNKQTHCVFNPTLVTLWQSTKRLKCHLSLLLSQPCKTYSVLCKFGAEVRYEHAPNFRGGGGGSWGKLRPRWCQHFVGTIADCSRMCFL